MRILFVILTLIPVISFFYYRARKNKLFLEKEKELDQLKSRFFTNISHEFKTPLTFIIGPIEELLMKNEVDVKNRLQLIRRNANKLLKLVNQLLDLSKIEAGKLNLLVTYDDIIPILKDITFSFHPLANKKNIKLRFHSDMATCNIYFDEEKVEKIINNLLSNAFRFTKPEGEILINISKKSTLSNQLLKIEITDTGIGINRKDLPNIFNRFYQGEYPGFEKEYATGIGLSLVKELTEIHCGSVEVNSEPGVGSSFVVTLPFGRKHFRDDQILAHKAGPLEKKFLLNDVMPLQIQNTIDTQKQILIVVETDSIRGYFRELLSEEYKVRVASSGEIGLVQVFKHQPDLIISDIKLPRISGYELCKQIKHNAVTEDIPVILLSAKFSDSDRLEGINCKADAFLEKPFNPHEIKARVRYLLNNKSGISGKPNPVNNIKSQAIKLQSKDSVFLQRLNEIMEQHIAVEGFGVEELSAKILMSRSNLHRKLKILLDTGPNQYIRDFRLNRARKLIEAETGSISEISYQVGFGSPSYFTRCFTEKFGFPPTDIKNQISFEI